MHREIRKPINWGFRGPYPAAMVQVLNPIAALSLVLVTGMVIASVAIYLMAE